MEVFTVIMLAINVALIIAIGIRFKSGEKPPRDYVAPSHRSNSASN